MKKFLAITAAILAGTSLFAFAGCNDGNTTALGGGLGGGAGTQAEAGAKSAYALGAVTTAGLLAETSQTANTVSLAAVTDGQNGQNSENGGQGSQDGAGQGDQNTQGENGQETPSGQGTQSDALKEEVARFGEYFEMLDTFLDEGALNVQVTENTDTSYAFSTKLTVEGTLPDGQTVVYTMYYTETEAGMREEQDEDEYEVRIAYDLTGVLEMNGVTYEMTGSRISETETEGREEETSESLWIKATDPENEGNYVRMDLEIESEQEGNETGSETEYVYRVYRDGALVEQTSVAFETETEGNRAETEYEVSILKDGAMSRFEVEREERNSGKTTIGVVYRTPDGNGRFVVTKSAEGEYVYTFEDGSFFEDDDFDFDD